MQYRPRVLFSPLICILDSEPHPAALNMAIDEALLQHATEPTLRIYQWERPAVSLGYFSKFAEAAAGWPGRDYVRRWTGGGIVPHGDDLTYSLVIPRAHSFAKLSPLESYRAIHEAVAAWLHSSGLAVTLASGAPKQSDVCFANPAPYDVVAGAQKVAGAAQRRAKLGLLHQGSIQGVPVRERAQGELAAAFAKQIVECPLGAAELALAQELVATKYGQAEWLQRW